MKVSVAWLAKDGVYAFAQMLNPGPAVLTRHGQHTEATLREQVKGVLAIRSRLGHPGDELARARDKIAMMKREMAKLMVERDLTTDKLIVAQNDLKNLAESAEQMTEDYARAIEGLKRAMDWIAKEYKGSTFVEVPEPRTVVRGKIRAIDPILGLVVIDDLVYEIVPEIVPPHPIRAKVTAVDTKLGLVVIDAGRRKGVTKGTQLIVFRGDNYVGKVVVDEVFPDVSACHYVGNGMLHAEVGDSVTTQLEDLAE
jgi:hypothetical protein